MEWRFFLLGIGIWITAFWTDMRRKRKYDLEDDEFKRLKKASKSRRLIPFVGAGFTQCLSKSFPTWGDAIKLAAKTLNYDYEILTSVMDHYEIGELLRTKPGDLRKFAKALSEQLDDEKKARIMTDSPHHWLAELETSRIYTTNWDCWIERALVRANKKARIINTIESLHLTRGDVDVIKFHGDLKEPKSLVFAESGYHDRMRLEHPFDVLLRADCLQSSLLFMGYSFKDMHVRHFWNRLLKSLGDSGQGDVVCRAYLCLPGYLATVKQCMNSKNITVIGLDPLFPTESLNHLLADLVSEQ